MPTICPECGNPFERRKHWQKYCSKDCNQLAYLHRKLEKIRGNPLHAIDALDLDLDRGPSEAQEAEWKRRSEVADEVTKAQNLEREQDQQAKAEKIANIALDDIQSKEALESWFRGKP